MSELGISPQSSVNEDQPRRHKKILRPIGAALLSLLQPGAGQALNRQWRKAAIFAVLGPSVLILAGLLRLIHTPLGLALLVAASLSLMFFAAVDAFRNARRHPPPTPQREHRVFGWIFLVTLVLNVLAQATDFHLDVIIGCRANVVRSDTMSPTLLVDDRVISNVKHYQSHSPARGELIIFDFPKAPSVDGRVPRWIKRIVAVAGDTLELRGSQVIVNGQVINEPYADTIGVEDDYGPIKVPEGHVFVMGDRRANSYDSRYWGPLSVTDLRGRPLYIYWSNDKARIGTRLN